MTSKTGMNFEGRWIITIATPIGQQVVALQLVGRDGRLSGTATHGDETVELLDPQLDAGRLRWTQMVTRPMRLTLKFDVECDGDMISGTAKPGILPSVKVSGRRASDQHERVDRG